MFYSSNNCCRVSTSGSITQTTSRQSNSEGQWGRAPRTNELRQVRCVQLNCHTPHKTQHQPDQIYSPDAILAKNDKTIFFSSAERNVISGCGGRKVRIKFHPRVTFSCLIAASEASAAFNVSPDNLIQVWAETFCQISCHVGIKNPISFQRYRVLLHVPK